MKSDINSPPAFVIWKVNGPENVGGLVPLPHTVVSVQSTSELNVPNGDCELLPPDVNPVVNVPATYENALFTLNDSAAAGGGEPVKTIPLARVSVTLTVLASTWLKVIVANGPVPQQLL